MRHRTPDPVVDQSNSRDPLPDLRGLRPIITVVRIRYLLAHLGPRHTRNRRILSDATAWLVIALALFNNSTSSPLDLNRRSKVGYVGPP